ncbi:HlyD family type I secretion periplasmic adaptor subunit [Cardinium endosymbiont of Nabis limbatus]|uniref:HlyD family type I secretion periplasmic adaptor subunit n=1 Tax=Cardinium endosymbiont of Nabis limbatus TaxID=3066217 RepID=UPI003AF3A996
MQRLYRIIRTFIQQRYIACFSKKHRSDDQYAFLPSYLELIERPPSPTALVTSITITTLTLSVFIWACLGQLDIHVSATGRLTLPSRSQLVQPYETGEVVEILVQNGQHVTAGERLLALNIVGSAQEIERCQEEHLFQQLAVARYRALLSNDPLNGLILPNAIEASIAARTYTYLTSIWEEYQSMLSKFDAELKTKQSEQIAHQRSLDGLQKLKMNIQKRLISSRELAKSDFMAKMTLLEKEKEGLEIQLSIATKQEELKVLQTSIDTLRKVKANYIAQKQLEWHDNLNKASSSLLIATQELAKAQDRGRLQILRAPLDGTVQQLAIHTIGGIVQVAQILMVIVPYDAPQQAEIDIANKDVGFIRPGQSVTVKVEAFPYSRYGTISGKVLSLSRDSVKRSEQNPELVFPAQIELDQNHMVINDQLITLTPGMTITTEIKLGKRRIIDYLLSPIREYCAESCREP